MNEQLPNPDSPLLTVGEVSRMLNVSERMVRRLISQNDLASLHIGRSICNEKQSVCHFIETQRTYNNDCVGLAMRDPQGERKCLKSARSGKVSSDALAQSTGGPLTPTQAVEEFNDLLGRPARAKR